MAVMNRREVIRTLAGTMAASTVIGPGRWVAGEVASREGPTQATGCTLGYSTYPLPELKIEQAIGLIAKTGYDSIEFCILSDRDVDPQKLDTGRRKQLRQQLGEAGLVASALMENLQAMGPAKAQPEHLDRLKRACQLAHDLDPQKPPVVQTVLGGKNWEQQRGECRDRLATWLEVANAHKVVLGIKPHRFQAMNLPTDYLWLYEQLGKPAQLEMVFDYSHYLFGDLSLQQAIRESLPVTAHIAVKDAIQEGDKVRFDLPGEANTIDYAALLKQFYQGGYRGDVCVEVSSQLWRQPGYDSQAAIETSYRNLSQAFRQAGVPRRSRS